MSNDSSSASSPTPPPFPIRSVQALTEHALERIGVRSASQTQTLSSEFGTSYLIWIGGGYSFSLTPIRSNSTADGTAPGNAPGTTSTALIINVKTFPGWTPEQVKAASGKRLEHFAEVAIYIGGLIAQHRIVHAVDEVLTAWAEADIATDTSSESNSNSN